jgi:hypothetical protein
MSVVMTSAPPLAPPRRRAQTRALSNPRAPAVLLAMLVSASLAVHVCAATAATPTFPVPASAKPPAGATSSTATAGAATPTTTYAPSGGASAPSTAGAATPGAPAGALPGATTSAPGATTPTTPAATTPTTPGAATATGAAARAHATASKGDRPLSTGAIVIAALAALLVLACLAWALARRSVFEPHWLLSLRHAIAEAGFRASATWSEFADWARLGR